MAQDSNPYAVGAAGLESGREDAQLGRSLVRVAGALFLLNSAYVILVFNLLQGQERLPQQLIRFAVTAVGVYYLDRGSRTIRWIAVLLGSIAALGFLMSVERSIWVMAPVGVSYVVGVILLVLPGSVRRFFAQAPR